MSRLRRSPEVAVVDDQPDERVYLARVPAGPVIVLEGPAASVWHAALAGDEAGVVERVARARDAAPVNIRDDVETFLAALVAGGYLERSP